MNRASEDEIEQARRLIGSKCADCSRFSKLHLNSQYGLCELGRIPVPTQDVAVCSQFTQR